MQRPLAATKEALHRAAFGFNHLTWVPRSIALGPFRLTGTRVQPTRQPST